MRLSVIVPACNEWNLTKNCLESLALHTPDDLPGGYEVILLDNASNDATPAQAPSLGAALFGKNFHYLREPQRLNFAQICNKGAAVAKGEFLFFLHNDTVLTAGWLPGLLAAFEKDDSLGACGPLLLYPGFNNMPGRVQQAGIAVSPLLTMVNLYSGFPANHPAVCKERKVQMLTAAAFLIPAALFANVGRFDEGYVNGFEDAELCLRLKQAGYSLKVLPAAAICHLESKNTQQGENYDKNRTRLLERVGNLLTPDLQLHAQNDGFRLYMDAWLHPLLDHQEEELAALAPHLRQTDPQALEQILLNFPLWRDGYCRLADLYLEQGKPAESLLACMLGGIPNWNRGCHLRLASLQLANGDPTVNETISWLGGYLHSAEGYKGYATTLRRTFAQTGLDFLVRQCDALIANYKNFIECEMFPFMRMLRDSGLLQVPLDVYPHVYRVWTTLPEGETSFRKNWLARQRELAAEQQTAANSPLLSVIMPVYNPDHSFLEEAINSVRNQTYGNWELCLADDASPDPQIMNILRRHAREDNRIKLMRRKENGHISAASNSALELASGEFCVLMDHDDTLPPFALEVLAAAICARPEASVFFSDEDLIEENYDRFQPHLKWGLDAEQFMQQNCLNHIGVYSTALLRSIGGFRQGLEGSQDYDLALRCIEKCGLQGVVHIPLVLYHWRYHAGSTAASSNAKSYAVKAFQRALREHCSRLKINADVLPIKSTTFFRLRHHVSPGDSLGLIFVTPDAAPIDPKPLAQLAQSAQRCLRSLTVLAPEAACAALQNSLELLDPGLPPVKILALEQFVDQNSDSSADSANSACLVRGINHALGTVKGTVLGLLQPGLLPHGDLADAWAQELLGQALRPETGCVGAVLHDTVSDTGGNTGDVIMQAGRVVTADGRLHNIYRGLEARNKRHFFRHWLVHTAAALSPCGIFAAREKWLAAGPWPEDLGLWGAAHTCLSLHEQGLRSICTPFAPLAMSTGREVLAEPVGGEEEARFYARWGAALQRHPVAHPALLPVKKGYTLIWNSNA